MVKTFWRFVWRALLIALLLVVLYQIWIVAHLYYWNDHNPASSAFMRERLAELQKVDPHVAIEHRWMPYDRISMNLKRAIVAAEDAKFLDHDGFDWDGIQKAMERNQKRGHIVAGGSTITQQLAKNLFLSERRTPWRKAQEAVVTVMLEHIMSKRRILEIYLNIIEWGNGIFGAEAAAEHYFGVSATQLSPYQAARLAAMVPNPRYYDEHRSARGLNHKAGIIVARMNTADVP